VAGVARHVLALRQAVVVVELAAEGDLLGKYLAAASCSCAGEGAGRAVFFLVSVLPGAVWLAGAPAVAPVSPPPQARTAVPAKVREKRAEREAGARKIAGVWGRLERGMVV
jgi:hypothetical protein